MNNQKSTFTTIFTIALLIYGSINSIGQENYFSGITVPDKTVPKASDRNDVSIKYANDINTLTLRKHLQVIASDSLEGRETGTPGIDKAAQYITQTLGNMGINSPISKYTYYQNVSFVFSKWLETDIYVNKERFRHLWDYLAFPDKNESSPLINVNEVIFLGYGIDDPKYSDYTKIDVKDKVIMINAGEPINKDSISYITGTKALSEWSDADMARKLKVAKDKGVKLVLIIENDIKKLLDQNRHILMGGGMQLGKANEQKLELANHVHISTTIAKAIIGDKDKKIIKIRKKHLKGKSESLVLKADFAINMVKDVKSLLGNNIMAIIEGKSKPEEVVIVSAHYDHLGKRGDEIYNGADDNGSGTVTLMELVQSFKLAMMEGNQPERSVAFIWFCGEEKGLLGSLYYSKHPVIPFANTVADVNVDMVGRIEAKYKDDPNYVYVIGSDRLSSDLHKINEEVNQKYTQLTLDYTYNDANDPNNYYYRSDHYNFAKNGIPSIFFFNGTHEDYHRTTDDIEKIDFDVMAERGKHIFHCVWALANSPERIKVDVSEKAGE